MSATFEKRVTFRPAFDRRDPNPTKDYGIHGVELICTLIGPLGAIQFELFTNWQLPHVTFETVQRVLAMPPDPIRLKCAFLPSPATLGYHAYAPQYEGQQATPCDLLPGGRCYSDVGFHAADPIFDRLLREGDDGLWAAMEEAYQERFTQPALAEREG